LSLCSSVGASLSGQDIRLCGKHTRQNAALYKGRQNPKSISL
jgi:hypothetical protein